MLNDTAPLSGYLEPYGLLCAILQDGTREWREEIEPNLPEEAMVWQPQPGLHSIGAIILHIAEVEVFWFETVVLGLGVDAAESRLFMSDEIDQDAWKWPVPHAKPLRWYFELHDRIRARTLESIKRWPAPDVVLRSGERQRTPRWIFGHVIQHESYHGGQAVLLNRLWELDRT